MDIHIFTLAFNNNLEEQFKRDYFKSSLSLLRLSFILGILYYSVFVILDIVVLPDISSQIAAIRFLFVIPVIIVIFLLSFTRHFYHWWQLGAVIATVVSGLGIVIMTTLPHAIARHYYYAGMMLILIYCYMLIRLRFIWATAAGWTIIGLYLISVFTITGVPTEVLTTNLFFLISANILGMFGGYALEYYTRKDFYSRYLLEQERKKVEEINDRLEERVREKTKALESDIRRRIQAEKQLRRLKDTLQAEVNEKTKELKERVSELEKFHDATIDRELRMNELREEIERLKAERG